MMHLQPRSWSDNDGYINLRYDLDHRVHAAKAYPVKSPNGSTIVVSAHDGGLKFIWRGGRPFKNHTGHANGNAKRRREEDEEDIEMIDGPDGAPAETTLDDFENEEEELDPSSPYPPMVDSFNLDLKSPAIHLAFPSLSSTIQSDLGSDSQAYDDEAFPRIFRQDVVLAVTCRDSSVHLVRVPLMPMRPQPSGTPDYHSYEDVVVSLPQAKTSLRGNARGLAITWTTEIDMGSASYHDEEAQSWTILVATTTSEARGMLRIYGIPILCRDEGSQIDADSAALVRSEYLTAQPGAVAFKPSASSSNTNTQLLFSDARGAVRLYDPFPRLRAAADSSTGGHFLTCLLVPFKEIGDSSSADAVRLGVLDIAWTMSGSCILVLLENGQWGIWDLEGVGPTASSGLLQGVGGGGSISGAAVTPFALRSFVGYKSDTRPVRLSTESESDGGQDLGKIAQPVSKLAPMTPNTRKSKSGRLFSHETRPATAVSHGGIVRGGISTVSTPIGSNNNQADDSVVLWYQSEVFPIPSLRSCWERAAKKSMAAGKSRIETLVEGTLYASSVKPLARVAVGGAAITSISQISNTASAQEAVPGTLREELLIGAEHCLVYVRPPPAENATTGHGFSRMFVPPERTSRPMSMDQQRLSRGDLDLAGMDRLLSGMDGGIADDPFAMSGALVPAARRVGFAAGY